MRGIRGSMSLILTPTNAWPKRPSMLSPATEKGSRIGEPGTIEISDEKEPVQLELPFDSIKAEETKEENQSDMIS